MPCPKPNKPAVKTDAQTSDRRPDIDDSTPNDSTPTGRTMLTTFLNRPLTIAEPHIMAEMSKQARSFT